MLNKGNVTDGRSADVPKPSGMIDGFWPLVVCSEFTSFDLSRFFILLF